MENIFGIENEIITSLVDKIQAEKQLIVEQKLREKGVLDYVNKRKNHRFKPMMIEIKGTEETYYFDDGTKEGFRLVTFRHEQNDKFSDLTDEKFHKIEIKLNYF